MVALRMLEAFSETVTCWVRLLPLQILPAQFLLQAALAVMVQ
jgi:hypothetical protein